MKMLPLPFKMRIFTVMDVFIIKKKYIWEKNLSLGFRSQHQPISQIHIQGLEGGWATQRENFIQTFRDGTRNERNIEMFSEKPKNDRSKDFFAHERCISFSPSNLFKKSFHWAYCLSITFYFFCDMLAYLLLLDLTDVKEKNSWQLFEELLIVI